MEEQAQDINIETNKHTRLFNKTVYLLSLFTILVAIIGLGVFFYWSFVPEPVLVIKDKPFPVEKTIINNGDIQVLDFKYCKLIDIKGSVMPSLISNKQVILLPSGTETIGKGCKTLRAPIFLPFVRFTDTYHFHYVVVYQVNPVRKETIVFDSQPFKIIGSHK